LLDNILFSANAVIPIFVLFTVGYLLKQKNFFTEPFLAVADKLVFKIALPCLLFSQVAFAKKSERQPEDLSVIWFCIVFILITCLIPALVFPLFMKNCAVRGAFIQGVYRSNFAILGIPLANSLFGSAGTRIAAIMLAIVIPLYNVLAVWLLTVNDPCKLEKNSSAFHNMLEVLKGIVKNPLIISIVLALPFYLFSLTLPNMIKQSITYFADISTPLALLTIGANFNFSSLKGRVGLALCATFLKTAAVPAVYVTIAALLGFRGVHLGIIYIVFGSPTAVSSYIMAKNMNSDYQLAGQIVLLTTLFSILTVFCGSFLLRTTGLI
jgi:Predicted permeases